MSTLSLVIGLLGFLLWFDCRTRKSRRINFECVLERTWMIPAMIVGVLVLLLLLVVFVPFIGDPVDGCAS